MGNVFARGRDVSCDFCGTGTEGLKLLVRDPSKGKGSSSGGITKRKICSDCLEKARTEDPEGWNRRIESGRYSIEEL